MSKKHQPKPDKSMVLVGVPNHLFTFTICRAIFTSAGTACFARFKIKYEFSYYKRHDNNKCHEYKYP